MTEDEWRDWHDDGHEMTVEVCIETGRDHKYVASVMKVHCPEGSFCRRWSAEHGSPDHCFVKAEIDAVGHWDFIEMMNMEGIPDDWSSAFPIRLAWRDMGEDGLEWRPSESPLTRFFRRVDEGTVSS